MTTKGRRAADRRRERQGKDASDGDEGQTSPGVLDPEELSEESSASSELAVVSEIREVERTPPPGTPARQRPIMQGPESSAEASFVKAVQQVSRDAGADRAEITAVREAPAKVSRGGRLVVIEGPDHGGEATLAITPSLIGRASDAEIGLSDPCVSRRHAELAFINDVWVIMDLGSKTGTLVNGVALREQIELRHGDVIALGQTELRFLRAAELPQPRPAPPPPPIEPTERLPQRERTITKRKKPPTVVAPAPPRAAEPDPAVLAMRAKVRRSALRVIGVSIALFVVMGAGRVVYDRFFSHKNEAQVRAQVAALLAEGRRQIAALDVDAARDTARTVLALDPDNADGQSLEKTAITEAEARDAIALALRLGDEARDVEAAQILQRVPHTSVFAPARDRLRRTLEERDRVRSRRNIESLLDQGRVDEAKVAAEKHVAEFPADADGKKLLMRASTALASRPKNPKLADVRAAFARGDISTARAIAQQNGLLGYLRNLDDYQRELAEGRALLKQTDGCAAADPLDDAFHLFRDLGGGASTPLFQDVRKSLADALYLCATEKLGEGGRGRCEGARALFRAARVSGDDPKIQAKLRDLDADAVAGLERARGAKVEDPDRAAAIAREHLCLARSGTRTYTELRALSRF